MDLRAKFWMEYWGRNSAGYTELVQQWSEARRKALQTEPLCEITPSQVERVVRTFSTSTGKGVDSWGPSDWRRLPYEA
eukprot:5013280-Alexandrium_andersonii.AAC.1